MVSQASHSVGCQGETHVSCLHRDRRLFRCSAQAHRIQLRTATQRNVLLPLRDGGHVGMRRQQALRERASRIAAMTESAELALGTVAPPFELLEPLTGRTVSSADFREANALLVVFMCNHCPFVRLLKDAIVRLAKDYEPQGVQVVAISANSVETHPQDGPEKMAEDAREHSYPFPYLYDQTQEVAKEYQAACTPEFFVFDKESKLQYHGQFDNARPSNKQPVTGADVRGALDTLLAGKEPSVQLKPSIGCNIKWHPGKEPAYAQ